MISKLNCKRCKHEWIRRMEELPNVCPRCKSAYWDKEKKDSLNITYIDLDNIIDINRNTLKKLPLKKADSHKVLSIKALMDVSNKYKGISGDIWDKASYLLRELIKKHPFASGNRRTALIAVTSFLQENGQKIRIRNNENIAKVLQGIREDYYSISEIKEWLMKGEIRDFNRQRN